MNITEQFIIEGEFYSVKAGDNNSDKSLLYFFMNKKDAEAKQLFLRNHWDWTSLSHEYMQQETNSINEAFNEGYERCLINNNI